MTKNQINYLKGKYGEDKLAIVVFGDGKRIAVTKEMFDEQLIEFDDGNEIIIFKEPHAIFSDMLSHKNRYMISCFEYASIIGLIFMQNEEDMYYNGENGDGNVFMHRNPRTEQDNEVKLREKYENIIE